MQIRQLITTPPVCVGPDASVRDVAVLMKIHDIGVVPIVSESGLVGLLTDRDLLLRLLPQTTALSEGPVSQAMSTGLVTCFADQDAAKAAAIMGDNQVRRLPVLDRSGELLGVLSVGDIAEICVRRTGWPGSGRDR